jgi:nitroreductase/NAD-dependent dihydropyrimidine dehydrogenase PreA subunit
MTIKRIKSRCNLCLLCVRECVSGAWRLSDGKPVMAAPELCNRCGHCVAVCPRSAIFHESLDYQQIEKTQPYPGDADVHRHIVRSRRSIRQFKQKPVDRDVLLSLLELSSHSPTASNRQNVAYTVITDRAVLGEVSERVFGFSAALYRKTRTGFGKQVYRLLKFLSPEGISRYLDPMDYYIRQWEQGRDYILHKAPVLILVHGPRGVSFISENCNIAATNLMNGAHASGLGSCYIGFLVLALKLSGSLRKTVQVPRGRRVYAALVLGHPAYHHPFTASRKKPVISWITDHD